MQITEKRVGEYQCGFRRGRSTIDQIFVVWKITGKHYEHGGDLHLLFIDYKSAFDNVNRRNLVESMHRIGIPKNLIKLARMTVTETYAKVKIENKLGHEFKYNSGVKQGDGLSTTLFNVILQTAVEKVDKRGTVFTKFSQICAYTDDVTILAKTENELKRLYKKLEAAANELGLYTNETETKYMSITKKQEDYIAIA
jgi:sorting nexin-29